MDVTVCSTAVQVNVHVESGAHNLLAELLVAGIQIVIEEAMVEERLVVVEPLDPVLTVSKSLFDLRFGLRSAFPQASLQHVKGRGQYEHNEATERGVLTKVLRTHNIEVHKANTVLVQYLLHRGFTSAVPRVVHHGVLKELARLHKRLELLRGHKVVALTIYFTRTGAARRVGDRVAECIGELSDQLTNQRGFSDAAGAYHNKEIRETSGHCGELGE